MLLQVVFQSGRDVHSEPEDRNPYHTTTTHLGRNEVSASKGWIMRWIQESYKKCARCSILWPLFGYYHNTTPSI